MKKNAILNSKTVTQESWMKKDNKNSVIELGKLNKNVSYSDINKAKNKRIKFKRYIDINKDTNVEQNFKIEINEKEVIEQIKTGNDSLKMENIKFENFQINNIKSINNKNIDEN